MSVLLQCQSLNLSHTASPMPESSPLLNLSAAAFTDEPQAVQLLLKEVEPLEPLRNAILTRAAGFVQEIRAKGGNGVEAFLGTYGLDTREGIAVMCLAEALLRIPDRNTADKLIHSTFENTQWAKYLGSSDSFFVNASSWGLMLTGAVTQLGSLPQESPTALLGKIVSRLGEPIVREALKQAMRHMGTQFVLGESIEDALINASEGGEKGIRYSFDMLGEGARTHAQAEGYLAAYRHAISAIGKQSVPLMEAPSISVKLSALHPRYSLVKEKRAMDELLPRIKEILLLAAQAGISVSLDAEESARLDLELTLYSHLLRDPALKSYDGIGFVLQAYQKRSLHVLNWLVQLCHETGRRIPLRLVKGAYWDSEIKQAQILGLPSYPVFTRKEHTDVSYLACARKMLQHPECFYPQFATHNALTISAILEMAGDTPFELQRLHGMGEALHAQLLKQAPCRVYAPVGRHEDLLAYLIRRLLENGANTSFVHKLLGEDTPIETLLADPIAASKARGGSAADTLPPPLSLYSDRQNSRGLDLGNLAMLEDVLKDIAPHLSRPLSALPENADSKAMDAAISKAVQTSTNWQSAGAEKRAQIIENAATLLESNRAELIGLLVREAGKTLPDAIAELREAVDFCRYYAAQGRKLMGEGISLQGPTGEHNRLQLVARGVFACISPWNFPLAIFTGQVVAALVTGNTVLAKPAQQTPRIAALAVKLLHDAGVPKDALHLLTGDGGTIGTALTKDERINGVVFTGSMETARRINRTLAARAGAIVPFIAETGGQNCMVVDSSALPEQVCDDVILSAFGSAGQRCSALRVLYVQEEIADKLITLISGAMQELSIGNPAHAATDVGPVIDEGAQVALLAHITQMKSSAKLIATAPPPAASLPGRHFVLPHLFEIKSIRELSGEVFGPVLHVIRFKASEWGGIMQEINSTGYGLTSGLQSRIEQNVTEFTTRVHAGNVYVNRSMTGAVVGVQPFGGEGLSGTGPKAGGPFYLQRFVTERTVSINTAAIGGNVELLAKLH